MNREKESIRSLEPYVTNPTICSIKLDANEGDKDLYLDLLKKLGESDITLNYYPDDSYSELKKMRQYLVWIQLSACIQFMPKFLVQNI